LKELPMLTQFSREAKRQRVHTRLRKRVRGVMHAPRLSVFRSSSHIYAQVVDDNQGNTLLSASSLDKEVRETLKTGGNVAAAKVVGQVLARRAKEAGIARVVFDRGGYAYHGRIKALADAARESGLRF
jgi:large subunit ribosomal protein L18